MEEIKSALVFEKYIVNKVIFEINENHIFGAKEKIQFSISENMEYDDKKMKVMLNTKIFDRAKEKGYPFEMEVQITGYFEMIGEKLNPKFEANAVAILYPYVRAIVSTYTASANINPLILPAINVNAMLKNQKDNKEENL